MYTWNLFILYFGGWTLQKKAFSKQNKGHLGSRYIIYSELHVHPYPSAQTVDGFNTAKTT